MDASPGAVPHGAAPGVDGASPRGLFVPVGTCRWPSVPIARRTSSAHRWGVKRRCRERSGSNATPTGPRQRATPSSTLRDGGRPTRPAAACPGEPWPGARGAYRPGMRAQPRRM